MSSAKWQRHSTFLSVRWRTWIGRALMASAFLANEGVRWLASGNGSSGGASTGRPVAAPPPKEGGLFSPRHGDAQSATRQRADS
jgi:hypothetical protein